MLIPTLYVVRDLSKRGVRPDYLLLAVGILLWGQPQQSNVPGLTALVYMLQAYLPLYVSGAVLAYLLSAIPERVRERNHGAP
jgi:hypothetical protein